MPLCENGVLREQRLQLILLQKRIQGALKLDRRRLVPRIPHWSKDKDIETAVG